MKVLAKARFTNLGLVLLAASSVLLVVWSGRTATRADEVRRGHLLPVFHQEEVQRLELRRGNVRSVVVRRGGAGEQGSGGTSGLGAEPGEPADPLASEWLLTEPVETDADPVPVEKLLGSLRYATWERELPAPAGADATSPEALLSEQALAVTMGELSFELRLGQPSASPPGSRYVEVTGNGERHLYVVKKSTLDNLFVDGAGLRGRQISPYRRSSTARVVLSSAAGARRLRRVGDEFHFDGMQEDQRARRAEVERIFLALARSSADPLLEPAVAQAALSAEASVRVSITPTASDKPEASLEFGGTCPSDPQKAIAVRSLPEPLAGCVDRTVLHALREPASSLIDTGLFALRADEVDTIQIVEGEQVLDFAREGDGFVLRQPRSAPLDAEAAKDRLSRLLGINATLLPARDEPANAAQMNAAIVTLESSARPGAERTRETVRVSPPRADGTRLVHRDADGAVLIVPREESFALRADATLMKEHRIFDYPISAVRGIDIRRGTFKQVIQRDAKGDLRLLEPKGYEIDGGLAVELIDQLRTLRALRWVSDSSTAGFGLEKPRLSVKMQVQVEDRTIERTLLLGRAGPGGYYASVDRDPGVFVAPRSVDRSLGNLPLDRSIFSAERGSVVEVALAHAERGKILLKRVAGELTVQKGTTSSFDPERTDELLEAIETLRPEAAVHTGPATPGEGLRKPLLTVYVRRQSPESVGMPPIRFSVGSRDVFQDASIFYARHASVNATYALPRSQVQRLLDLF
jgi:hypothetical protein